MYNILRIHFIGVLVMQKYLLVFFVETKHKLATAARFNRLLMYIQQVPSTYSKWRKLMYSSTGIYYTDNMYELNY